MKKILQKIVNFFTSKKEIQAQAGKWYKFELKSNPGNYVYGEAIWCPIPEETKKTSKVQPELFIIIHGHDSYKISDVNIIREIRAWEKECITDGYNYRFTEVKENMTTEDLITAHYGKRGTERREEYEKKYNEKLIEKLENQLHTLLFDNYEDNDEIEQTNLSLNKAREEKQKLSSGFYKQLQEFSKEWKEEIKQEGEKQKKALTDEMNETNLLSKKLLPAIRYNEDIAPKQNFFSKDLDVDKMQQETIDRCNATITQCDELLKNLNQTPEYYIHYKRIKNKALVQIDFIQTALNRRQEQRIIEKLKDDSEEALEEYLVKKYGEKGTELRDKFESLQETIREAVLKKKEEEGAIISTITYGTYEQAFENEEQKQTNDFQQPNDNKIIDVNNVPETTFNHWELQHREDKQWYYIKYKGCYVFYDHLVSRYKLLKQPETLDVQTIWYVEKETAERGIAFIIEHTKNNNYTLTEV